MSVAPETVEIFQRWIARGDGHLAAAKVLVDSGDGATSDAACYHCHEAVATFVKAALTLDAVVMPRVHDLEFVHRLIPERYRFPADSSELTWLSTYGIEKWWDPDLDQAKRALEIARRIRDGISVSLGRFLDRA